MVWLKVFKTGIPRTYSTASLFISSITCCFSPIFPRISFDTNIDIMVSVLKIIGTMLITPNLQSKANMIPKIAIGDTNAPTKSGTL